MVLTPPAHALSIICVACHETPHAKFSSFILAHEARARKFIRHRMRLFWWALLRRIRIPGIVILCLAAGRFNKGGEIMNYRNYCAVSGVLFALVALAHFLRVAYGMPVQIDDYPVPMYFSWIGLLVPAILAVWAFLLNRGSGAAP